MDIKIHQPKIKGCDDSFFYDGLIAETEKFSLYAMGEIKIVTAQGETYSDDRARQQFENDKELDAGVREYLMNNWFEMVEKESGDTHCDVWYSYDEALHDLAEDNKTSESNDSL